MRSLNPEQLEPEEIPEIVARILPTRIIVAPEKQKGQEGNPT